MSGYEADHDQLLKSTLLTYKVILLVANAITNDMQVTIPLNTMVIPAEVNLQLYLYLVSPSISSLPTYTLACTLSSFPFPGSVYSPLLLSGPL